MDARPRTTLDDRLRQRYSRQIILPELGEQGQQRLADSSVLLVGLGGLGSPAALYLAAAGVGRLGLVEFDRVDVSNLQRQILYNSADEGCLKLEVAAERLKALNPDLEVVPIAERFAAGNALALVREYDLVLDGTDNFSARYAVNDACVIARVPNVHGAVQGFEGQVTVLAHPDGPCYRCLFPESPPAGTVPACSAAGVLGVLPGTIGLLQATEALKLLAGIGETLVGRLLRFDALAARFTEIRIAADPNCPVCGIRPSIDRPVELPDHCVTEAVGQEDEGMGELPFSISVDELARRRDEDPAPVVLDVRLPEELRIVSIPGDVLHIPLHQLPGRMSELDPSLEYAVLCHHGVRSGQATKYLRAHGYGSARNVEGGIDRWSLVVDPGLSRY
jgi:molybdopterin/thiamine biosynthesis adenylyltransferase/rhodanese-related sulfurtransferase